MKHPKNRLHSVVIVGATPAGVAAANKLGELGVPVTLVDNEANLDRKLSAEAYRLESGMLFNFANRPGLIRILRNSNIQCIMPAVVDSVKHSQQGFRITIDKQATYVDPERCTLCGKCIQVCPVSGTNGHQHPVHIDNRMALPGRAVIDKRRQPLCQANCPLGVNVQGYMALTAAGRYQEALDLIRKDNVLPGICGRICTHPCEAACRRAEKDGALAIRDIKRFVADHSKTKPKAVAQSLGGNPIAVVGSGPTGLAAAADLARTGYAVTVFEREKEAGGLLRYGIGPHRLPRNVLDQELAGLAAEGVTFVTGHDVAVPDGLTQLRENHQAVIMATGSWKDRSLGVEGENLAGVEGCLAYLNKVYRSEVKSVSGNLAVIGDGNAAFDLARVLRRMGGQVTIVSWFGQDEIPADAEEVHAARQEGISILDRSQVVGFAGDNGRMSKLQLRATRPGSKDASGIAWPEIIPASQVVEQAFDQAFVAIGQTGAYGDLSSNNGFKVTAKGLIEVDDDGRIDLSNIYAAGDAVTGASSVVKAMADGRRVARQVIRDLAGDTAGNGHKPLIPARPEILDFEPVSDDLPHQARTTMPELSISQRQFNFKEVAVGFDMTQARTEAQRCLQCGSCSQCFECLAVCQAVQAIRHDDQPETLTENAGVLIIADPQMSSGVRGDDVIRAYGPKSAKTDVHAMMVRGFSAAAKAMMLLSYNRLRVRGHGIAFVPPDTGLDRHIRIGIFACRCNDSLGWSSKMDTYLAQLGQQADVVHTEVLASACTPEGIQKMVACVRDKGLTRMVVASCVCCPLNFACSACTDQRSRLKQGLFQGTGISRSMVQACDLRGEVLRHLPTNVSLAENLFEGIMTRSVGRARKLVPFPAPARNYNFTTAVVGQTEAAQHAALTLAQAGFEVLIFGSDKHPIDQVPVHQNIFTFDNCPVQAVSGTIGDFQIHVRDNNSSRIFNVGVVILGEKFRKLAIYRAHADLPDMKVQVRMQTDKISDLPFIYPCSTSISGLFLADPPGIQISKKTKGEAAAMSAAAAMPRGPRQSRGFSVVIDKALCRGCGRCLKACPYQAINFKANGETGFTAVVDDVLCKGCGNCISVCPSNAADSPFRDQVYLEQTVEELLMAGSRS